MTRNTFSHFSLIFFVFMMSSVVARANTAVATDKEQVIKILADLDNTTIAPEKQLENYVSDAVLLAPELFEIRGKKALHEHLSNYANGVDLSMTHSLIELNSFAEVVIAQGKVVGYVRPHGKEEVWPFETKNIIIFRRQSDQSLKIWKVIYNAAPTKSVIN